MSAQNLIYLEKNWLTATSAQEALNNFRKWSPKQRRWILRHHDEEDITDEETWLRDEFDYLLGFYSIVEVAITIGFVSEIPPSFPKKHLPVLCDSGVRHYYELNYQLDLPRRLRERLQTGFGFSVLPSRQLNAFFYEFLELTRWIERDEDLESFLWSLDGGDRDGCRFSKVARALEGSRSLFEAIQTPDRKKSELQHALSGFCKFIEFCKGFSNLLSKMEGVPIVAETMWLAHAYWFRQWDSRIGDNLREAFKSLANWQVGTKDKKGLLRRVNELGDLMQFVSVPPMTRWKLGWNKETGKKPEMVEPRKDPIEEVEKLESYLTVNPTAKPTGKPLIKAHQVSITNEQRRAMKALMKAGFVFATKSGLKSKAAELSFSGALSLMKKLNNLSKTSLMEDFQITLDEPAKTGMKVK